VPEVCPPAVALLAIFVPAATVVRTRTWMVTVAGLLSLMVRVHCTVCPAVQLPELELALSTSNSLLIASSSVTC
jgi:hypothetical protein